MKQLALVSPPKLAIASGATSPAAAGEGALVWSTVTDSLLQWNGTDWQPLAGSGGASAHTGSAVLDFGASPGSNEAAVTVTGQTTIGTGSRIQVSISGDPTLGDKTSSDHRYVGLWLNVTAGTVVAGQGFTVYGRSSEKLQGSYQINWIWQ